MSRFHDKEFPGDSAVYREARDELLKAELDLRQRLQEIAELRSRLPLGGRLANDYEFEEIDPAGDVRQG